MSDVRFKEAAIEGKVPNSDNMRIDLRGSACDDTRILATLYDFDANGMLQSITYVWARPAGPAPAPVFQERARTLALNHPGLPAPQSNGRLQANIVLGRLVLQDMPSASCCSKATPRRADGRIVPLPEDPRPAPGLDLAPRAGWAARLI